MIRSQAFREPVSLDCELHQSSGFSLSLVGQDGWRGLEEGSSLLSHGKLELLDLGIFLPPDRLGSDKASSLGSDKIVSLRAAFVENIMLWSISK